MPTPKVHIETGEDRRKTVRLATEALGQEFVDKIKAAQKILVKVDLGHFELQLASTHVDAVRGLLDVIRTVSRIPVLVGDASHFGTKAAIRNFGYERLPHEYDAVSLVDLNDDAYVEEAIADQSIRRSQLARTADLKISLTPVKTDAQSGVWLAVKNWAVGTWLVPPRIGPHGQVWSRAPWLAEIPADDHHERLAALYASLPCDVAIVDGILAMQGNGPVYGTPLALGAVITGLDAIAVDTVATTLMGLDPHAVGYLERLGTRGIGVNEIGKIDVSPLLLSQLARQFVVPGAS